MQQLKKITMKKEIAYKLLGLAFLVTGLAACDTASQDAEPVISPDGYPTATIAPVATSVSEGNQLIINITTDKMIDRSLTFTFKQTGGTADADDYSVSPAVIAPYSKSVQMVINTENDYDFAASETIVGEIGVYSIAEKYLLNPATVNPFPLTITINNTVSPELNVTFSWNADVVIGGDTYDAADYIDFDFIVCPEAGFDINDPWATEIGIYDASTGSSPEHMTLSGLDNGTYLLVADLYYNDFVGSSDGSVMIPIVATFTRQGTSLIDTQVAMNPADRMADNTPGFDNDPSGAYNAVVAKVTVADDKYTVTKWDNTTIGPFKSANVNSSRPLNYRR
jgi:hypothetical protein